MKPWCGNENPNSQGGNHFIEYQKNFLAILGFSYFYFLNTVEKYEQLNDILRREALNDILRKDQIYTIFKI